EPRSTPAASRAEGLIAAYRLARLINDTRAERIASSVKASIGFQLSQQFDENNARALANPERAMGGFRESITSARVRIDFVQHNICSLIGAAETLF
ncbi:MAG TPA: hypothetical protein VNN73_05575, partial [Blastocatellia bacterium]|nr:hypothetical protein [Blastocatellia bacterium]